MNLTYLLLTDILVVSLYFLVFLLMMYGLIIISSHRMIIITTLISGVYLAIGIKILEYLLILGL